MLEFQLTILFIELFKRHVPLTKVLLNAKKYCFSYSLVPFQKFNFAIPCAEAYAPQLSMLLSELLNGYTGSNMSFRRMKVIRPEGFLIG